MTETSLAAWIPPEPEPPRRYEEPDLQGVPSLLQKILHVLEEMRDMAKPKPRVFASRESDDEVRYWLRATLAEAGGSGITWAELTEKGKRAKFYEGQLRRVRDEVGVFNFVGLPGGGRTAVWYLKSDPEDQDEGED